MLGQIINISKVIGIGKFLKTETTFKKKMIMSGFTSLLKIENLLNYLKSDIMTKEELEKFTNIEEAEIDKDKENVIFDQMI